MEREPGCFAKALHLLPGRLDFYKMEFKKTQSQRMLEGGKVMLGVFLVRDT